MQKLRIIKKIYIPRIASTKKPSQTHCHWIN
jgi:hypothetical protein